MILTVAFGKGGTAKTTTANSLLNAARLDGKRTLAIDCDLQSNLTVSMGGNPAAPGLYHVLTGTRKAADCIQHTQQGDLIAAGLNLSKVEFPKKGYAMILKNAIAPIISRYDLIVIDTPPAINPFLWNALFASDKVLLTMQARSFAIMGLYQIAQAIAEVQTINPALSVAGIVFTQHTPNRALSKELSEEIQEKAADMGTKVLNTYIRPGEALPQAQAMQQSIFEYSPRSNAAKDYKALYQELGL